MIDTRDDHLEEPGTRLIARIVEREARPADYDAFGQLAAAAPGRWHELLAALRDDDVLHLALEDSLATADRVELPAATRGGGLLRAARPWTGWMAAAALALVWFASTERSAPAASQQLASLRPDPAADGTGPRTRGAPATAQLASDPVLGEFPLRLVGSEPSADGTGVDLLYLQPVLRRTRVDHVFELGQDEHGRPAPVPVDPAVLVRHESL